MRTCLKTQRNANIKEYCLEEGGILASFILRDKVARNVSHPIKRLIWITPAAYSTRVQTLPIRAVLWIVKATFSTVSGRRWQIPTLRDIHSLRNCCNGHGNSILETSHLYAVRGSLRLYPFDGPMHYADTFTCIIQFSEQCEMQQATRFRCKFIWKQCSGL